MSMKINGMEEFQSICRHKLVEWYKKNMSVIYDEVVDITVGNTFVVWSVKTLQNYKCLVATDVEADGIYAEYTFNGDKGELYEDVYGKVSNNCFWD